MEQTPPPSSEPIVLGPDAWQWWQGVGGMVAAFFGAQFAGLFIFILGAGLWGGEVDDARGGTFMLALVAQDICFVVFAVLFADLRGGRVQAWMFGLKRPEWGRAIGTAALAYAVLVAFSVVWSQVVDVDGSDVADQLGVRSSDQAAIAGAFLVGFLAPIAEEFLFRGLIFRSLMNQFGVYGGALGSGLLFGLVHIGSAPIGAVAPLVLFGFLLSMVYVRTGSLLMCILLHSVNNAFAYGGLVDWTWQIPVMLFGNVALLLLAFRGTESLFGRVPLHLSSV